MVDPKEYPNLFELQKMCGGSEAIEEAEAAFRWLSEKYGIVLPKDSDTLAHEWLGLDLKALNEERNRLREINERRIR